MMPVQKPFRSKQDYGTPSNFLEAAKDRLRIIDFRIDLAATRENAITSVYYSLEDGCDSLATSWHNAISAGGWCWLNPPFSRIEPWVEKAAKEAMCGAQIAVLVPASVGSNWWREWVEPYAYQSFLNPRLTFNGMTTPYPKDCALLLYTPWGFTGHEIWRWNSQIREVPDVL